MAVLLVAVLAAFALLVWAGRQRAHIMSAGRLTTALFATLAAVAAVVAGLRGAWLASLILIACSAWIGERLRRPRSSPPCDVGEPMSVEQARSILGVAASSGPEEILAAYRRLMLRAHPDHGGSSGLASQLNAARERLLGNRRGE
jgi:hypothetical protein